MVQEDGSFCSELLRLFNSYHARLKCGRLWVPVKQKTIKLVFVASPLSTQH